MGALIYVLKSTTGPHAMIGSAIGISLSRGALADVTGRVEGVTEWRKTPLLRGVRVMGMIEESDFAATPLPGIRPITLIVDSTQISAWDPIHVSPEFERWVTEHTRPWDGREAEKLGVKGLGRNKPRAATSSTLADRLSRRRTR